MRSFFLISIFYRLNLYFKCYLFAEGITVDSLLVQKNNQMLTLNQSPLKFISWGLLIGEK